MSKNKKNPEYAKELAKLRQAKNLAQENLKEKQKILERKTKSLNEPKKLEFIFGINIHNRNADGLFIYNCNRLIIMFVHTKNQKTCKEYHGIVGKVNVPYQVLEPTHNKQQFQGLLFFIFIFFKLGSES